MADPRNWRQRVAETLIAQIEAGTAPWQKPWDPLRVRNVPHNPTSGTRYRGINAWWLEAQGRDDPRWLTYRQAQAAGAQVRKGETGTAIEYWRWEKKERVPGEDGREVERTVRLERPQVFYAVVFNAEQIDGLEPYQAPVPSFQPAARAEEVLRQAGVPILHDQSDRAFYTSRDDRIHLPPPAAFNDSYEYYATALHELGHATGHPGRLNREIGPFGGDAYAREELVAEMASFGLATELGLGHYPERHAPYLDSWLRALKADPNLLFRAARDAEQARIWVLEPERRPELATHHAERPALAAAPAQEKEASMTVSGEGSKRVYLSVPYEERNEAKAAGARWDRRAKSWYVRGEVSEALRRWQRVQDRGLEAAPESDFAAACATQGLVLKEPPAMDGRWHRVPVADDKPGQLSGSYRGWLDGRPAGVIMNYRSHERAVVWVSAGSTPLDAAALSQAQAESVERKQRLAAELEERQRRVAERAGQLFEQAQPPAEHPYLAAKGVLAHGIRATAENHILVPLREPGSEVIENLQVIREDGSKRFLAGGRKSGLCHLIGDDRDRNAPLLIAEGYATAASLHRATGLPVAVAFDAGNLEAVARAFRQREPERTIGVCADDDHAKRVNAGMDRGRQAAAAIGGQLIAPPLAPADRAAGATDWNDLAASRGLEAVGIEVLSALAAPRPDRRPAPEMRQTSKPARSPVAMGI